MGTTVHGLPYPEPTDPVANGAAAIRALAEAVDPTLDRATWNAAGGQIGGTAALGAADLGNGFAPGETPILVTPMIPYTEGRRVRVTMWGSHQCAYAGDIFGLAIRRGNGIVGSMVASQVFQGAVANQLMPFTLIALDVMTAAAGSPTQWTFTITRISGTGNLAIKGNNYTSSLMWVEDNGPVTKR